MPDRNGNDNGRAMAIDPPVVEAVRLPETPAERRKRRLEAALAESDEQRSKRRHEELHTHKQAHNEHLTEAHAIYPVPLDLKFENLTEDQQQAWNARSLIIASANRAYHLAVRQTFEEHQAENAHLQRTYSEAAKKAQEAV
jgi:hypothetical protein